MPERHGKLKAREGRDEAVANANGVAAQCAPCKGLARAQGVRKGATS